MAKKTKKESLDPTLPIFQVKISLQHVNPLIWRRVQTDDCSLDELHEIIQASMGWEDMHMNAFVIDDEEYGNPERGSDAEYDARVVRLSEILEQGSARFRYDYDFGDDWQHTIQIEKTLPAEAGVRYPRCVAGERACPPEDCGGPYGYEDMLATIEDPEDEKHEETLEWVGGEFDPEEFDLEEINEELQWLRRWPGNRRGKYAREAAFAKRTLVRVKPGVVHELYPDIPLGGWVGKIKRILWLSPLGYEVRWTKSTLDQAHPVYLERAQRDDIQPNVYWLDEDQVEAASDETPAAMEQPKEIVTHPLSEDAPDDRIRMVFGLTTDDALPPNDEQHQQKFLEYLKGHLSFPFKATDYWGRGKGGTITVLGFALIPPWMERKALYVRSTRGATKFKSRWRILKSLRTTPTSNTSRTTPIGYGTFWMTTRTMRMRMTSSMTSSTTKIMTRAKSQRLGLSTPSAQSPSTAPTTKPPRRSWQPSSGRRGLNRSSNAGWQAT